MDENTELQTAPDWITDRAKQLYTEQARRLKLAAVDYHGLAEWASSAATVEKMTQVINKEGEYLKSEKTNNLYTHPASNILTTARRQTYQLGRELGLLPKARKTMSAEHIKPKPDPIGYDADGNPYYNFEDMPDL